MDDFRIDLVKKVASRMGWTIADCDDSSQLMYKNGFVFSFKDLKTIMINVLIIEVHEQCKFNINLFLQVLKSANRTTGNFDMLGDYVIGAYSIDSISLMCEHPEQHMSDLLQDILSETLLISNIILEHIMK